MTKKAENNKNSTNTRHKDKKTPDAIKAQRVANLIPGANKNGRPKGKLNYDTRVDMAIEILAQKYVDDMNKKNKDKKGYKPMTLDDVDIEGDIFAQHLNKARNGDRHFIDSFLDRRYGKATQPITLPGSIFNTPEYEKGIKDAEKRMQAFNKKWFKK